MSADRRNPHPLRAPNGGRSWPDLAGSRGRIGQGAADRHNAECHKAGAPQAADKAKLQPTHCWAPAEGDAEFTSQPGGQVLALRDVTLTQLIISINVLEPGLTLHLDGDGGLGFVDQSGEPSPFSGNLTILGATLRFAAVSSIILV